MAEPVTLFEAKTHLRLEASGSLPDGYDDEYILSLITAARTAAENYLEKSLVVITRDLLIDEFPSCVIQLPMGPVTSITSIKYIDFNGVEQTLSSSVYSLFTHDGADLISTKYGQMWPSTRTEPNAVRIKYVAGYTDVPAPVKHAIKLLITDYYENRQGKTEGQLYVNEAVKNLLTPYKMSFT
jgi:uncharacterized phiE125 gp8 family phage protein